MKKKALKVLVYQQANTITKLNQENKYLREKFIEAKDFLMTSIVEIIGGNK